MKDEQQHGQFGPHGLPAQGDAAAFRGKRCAGHRPRRARRTALVVWTQTPFHSLWAAQTELVSVKCSLSQPTPAFLLLHRGRSSPAPSQVRVLLPALFPSGISAAAAEQKGRRQREVDVPSSIGLQQLPLQRAWLAVPAQLPDTVSRAKTKQQNTLNPQHPLHKGHAGRSCCISCS